MTIKDIDTLVKEAKDIKSEYERIKQEGISKICKEATEFIPVLAHAKSLGLEFKRFTVLGKESVSPYELDIIVDDNENVLGIGHVYVDPNSYTASFFPKKDKSSTIWIDAKGEIHSTNTENNKDFDLGNHLYKYFEIFRKTIEYGIKVSIKCKYQY